MTNVGFRKRSRSREDFNEEFPLSKRINNLQISGEFRFTQIPLNQHIQQPEETQQPNQHNAMPTYNPELTFEENPVYFRENNVLYDLYLERMRRNNKDPVL
ncbi:unnamed protein product [Chironomus riparius]|uniref:Uncharacterized protein n=1 Tax=Chironomus riparius TaxID=315576 RepID=A0A9N9WV66_9DIPT|nr:unnamed protein product [Chironomus riparius]